MGWCLSTELHTARAPVVEIFSIIDKLLLQWYSTWGTRTPVETERRVRGYLKTSYFNQNETQKPLEP